MPPHNSFATECVAQECQVLLLQEAILTLLPAVSEWVRGGGKVWGPHRDEPKLPFSGGWGRGPAHVVWLHKKSPLEPGM